MQELVFLPGGVRELRRNGEASCGREKRGVCSSRLEGVSPLEEPWGCPEEREPELLLRVGRRLWSGGAAPFPSAAAWSAVDCLDQTRFSRAAGCPAIWQKVTETVFAFSSAFHFPDGHKAQEYEYDFLISPTKGTELFS